MIVRFLAALALAASIAVPAQAAPDRRLVLVTLDGLHWTEVFRGADPERAADPAAVPFDEREAIRTAFIVPANKARALMPFLNDVVARQGVLLGDRDHGGCAAVGNAMWFSYPGYNEILTGKPDPAIVSNAHGLNRNVTFLEWLNRRPGFAGRVETVASWRVHRDILDVPKSGLSVNAGWEDAPARTPTEATIARLQAGSARIWPEVRLDTFTHAYALELLKRQKPKVLYVAYGETDDFAHDGRYDQVLWAAQRADRFLGELWAALQADPAYAGKTTLIVTTDHGRGTNGKDGWRHHGKPFAESNQVWIGAIGPDIAPGRQPGTCASSSQIAATALTALGVDWRAFDPAAGPPLAIQKP
ncbi:MAG: alkaline phosphatase family protein [Alphaproteobacteria bacterium]|nr:alkaline phosphatase family protein [Alphaproteobacteria bacterium]MBU1514615.1 alkaline phosphatase family protein [Alphaproteobacteria bacterium]MBU2096753.1 alkaline phosphatase family protein [Alphaproteobacteria bacterium]MBU2150385.1 alkaline phosphatase family protein [Alphaproteobacteria bacterium]MBU2306614.1 alkaline phosphatase family protein [Alphaproteobacteria bacterium]